MPVRACRALLLMLLGWLVVPGMASAQAQLPQQLIHDVAFEQRLGAQLPLDGRFIDSAGNAVRLGDLFADKPVLLAMGYYECPMLCSLVRNELFAQLQELDFTVGRDFELLVVSIDPAETPATAASKRLASIVQYGRTGSETGWHFWVGDEANIGALAEAVGFQYTYDPRRDEYLHPSGIILLTPRGTVSSYLLGLEYPTWDLRIGLVAAAAGQVGSLVDQLLLLCYHYDPVAGEYTLAIMNIVRAAGLLTVLIIAVLLFVLFRQERQLPSPTA